MTAVLARPLEFPPRSAAAPPHLTLNTSLGGTPTSIPNKHIPYCSPGPIPICGLLSPPATPPLPTFDIESQSTLYPPKSHTRLSGSPPVYALTAAELADAVEHISKQPLPEPGQVFPWLHGLHEDNREQLAFFAARKRSSRRTPGCIRGLTIVKTGSNLNVGKLKGAIAPEELLVLGQEMGTASQLVNVDPTVGFSVRNFHIQACKMATVSDIVVYGDDATPKSKVQQLGTALAQAQRAWEDKAELPESSRGKFNTFIITDSFDTFEKNHPELVVLDARGIITGNVVDFFHQERLEMRTLSKPSELTTNVWLGPTPDSTTSCAAGKSGDEPRFDVLIEANDYARMPEAKSLPDVRGFLSDSYAKITQARLEVPSSGSIDPHDYSDGLADRLTAVCRWIHKIANPEMAEKLTDDGVAEDAVATIDAPKPRRVLIHCPDGYTETSLLGLAYLMFAERILAHEAWIRLHREKGRNFFAYASDKSFLEHVQCQLLQESPHVRDINDPMTQQPRPEWMRQMDGSLPSRILPYLYLGNLSHAINPGLLAELGITQVLSVGEAIRWHPEVTASWGAEKFLLVDKVQDNGVDPLTHEFERCLAFIEKGKSAGGATLVHCRVGVSRSATICIAEVMNEFGLSFPRAYCFVRARRLNVIIQPHLRFSYELLKWEEHQCRKRGVPLRRELEWATIAREIAAMNKPYCRQ